MAACVEHGGVVQETGNLSAADLLAVLIYFVFGGINISRTTTSALATRLRGKVFGFVNRNLSGASEGIRTSAYVLRSLLSTSFSAVARASVALTFTSGSTPVIAQSLSENGLTGLCSGIPTAK